MVQDHVQMYILTVYFLTQPIQSNPAYTIKHPAYTIKHPAYTLKHPAYTSKHSFINHILDIFLRLYLEITVASLY